MVVVFLDKLAAAILYRLPDFLQVPAFYLDRHEAVEQGKSVVEVRAEYGGQEKPRLRRLRGLRDAEDFRIGQGLPLLSYAS
jgi:hypothetical protein